MEPPRSILVLKPSSFGDIIHTLPAAVWLKNSWPEATISWLVNTEWSPLLEGNPVVDRVVPFPRKQFRQWRGLLALPRWLRSSLGGESYDLVLDYQGLLRTALLGRFARGTRFLGLADAREGAAWFYDRAVPVSLGRPHAVERYLALSRTATESRLASHLTGGVSFPLPAGEPIEESAALQDGFILIHPFARGRDKSLSSEQVLTLCAAMPSRQIVLVGGMAGQSLDLPPHCLNLLNRTTLRQLIWLVRRAGFVISVDSGPAHLAAALAKAMVAIHTWSDPRRVGPYLPDAWIWKNGQLLRFRDLGNLDEAFFEMPLTRITDGQIEAIGRLAISS